MIINLVVYFLILAIVLFNSSTKRVNQVVITLFCVLLGLTIYNYDFSLNLWVSISLILIYFIFILTLIITKISYINYLIIFVISLSFIFYLSGHMERGRDLMELAFYSLIILILRLSILHNEK